MGKIKKYVKVLYTVLYLHVHTCSGDKDNYTGAKEDYKSKNYCCKKVRTYEVLLGRTGKHLFYFQQQHPHAHTFSLLLSFSMSLSLSTPSIPSPFFGRWYGGPRCYISLANGEQRGAGLVCTPDAPSFKNAWAPVSNSATNSHEKELNQQHHSHLQQLLLAVSFFFYIFKNNFM